MQRMNTMRNKDVSVKFSPMKQARTYNKEPESFSNHIKIYEDERESKKL